jgi:UDP-glucose 4-epimerase
VIVYFYNVYGDRKIIAKEYFTLVDIWKDCVRNKEKFTIVAPGTQLRNFTYIGDIVEGIIIAGEKGKGDGYPLGAE